MSAVTTSVGGNVSTPASTLALDEIQAIVLRPRPAPDFGAYVLLRIDDTRARREFLRRLTPHSAPSANWWNTTKTWLAVAISYKGLEALGLPKESLLSF